MNLSCRTLKRSEFTHISNPYEVTFWKVSTFAILFFFNKIEDWGAHKFLADE